MNFCLRWGNCISHVVQIHSGFLRNNLLSPKFFSVYIDNLLRKLESSDYGCKLFGCFCGAIFYANDIFLLFGSIVGLQCMMELNVEYGEVFGITFNALIKV